MQGSIRQRSPGSWEITLDVGRDGAGRRRRRYKTLRGTKAQAQRELRRLLSSLDAGMSVPDENILLRDWLDRWLREVIAPHRRYSTWARYRQVVDRDIVPAIGHIPLVKLSPSHIQAHVYEVAEVSFSVGKLIHTVLSGALKYALRMEIVVRNPVAAVRHPPSKKSAQVYTPDTSTVLTALDMARDEQHHLWACIHLVAYTGLRRGEALGLTWPNVNLQEGYLNVEGSVGISRELGITFDPPKSEHSRRRVDLDHRTVEVLKEYRDSQWEAIKRLGREYLDEGRVFADADGGWVNPYRLSYAVRKLGKRLGSPRLTVHSLRHFHASVALQAGQNVVVVSKRLGHANVSITSDVYAHVLPGWQKETAEAFADAMASGRRSEQDGANVPESVDLRPIR